jgi:ADP-heptose:LPS heptosyltransferase
LRKIGTLRAPASHNQRTIERILVSHPYSSVGDLVLLLPLLEKIRSEWPSATIDVAVGSGASELLSGVEGLHRTFVCGSQNARIALFGIYKRFFRNLLFYKREIMPFGYDLAIAPRWGSIMTSEAVYLAYLTGAPLRIGYSATVDHGDPVTDSLLTCAVVGGALEHETTRNLRLLDRALLIPSPQEDVMAIDRPVASLRNLAGLLKASPEGIDFLSRVGAIPRAFAVISPGATRAFNRWPVQRLAAVVRELYRKTGVHFYIIGSSPDAHLCTDLARLVPECSTSIAGTTNLRQLTCLLSESALFLGMDSGTAHIAGGLGVPTLVISPFPSGCKEDLPNSPIRFRPCGPYVRVLQPAHPTSPCSPNCTLGEPHCILQIGVEEVVIEALELINRAGQLGKTTIGSV